MERRTFLSAGSASVLALTAGVPSTAADADPSGPTAPVRAYYQRAAETESARSFANQVPDLAHSASPLRKLAADAPTVFDDVLEQDLVDMVVTRRDVDAGYIEDISGFLAGSLSDAELETLAETNAVVAVTVDSANSAGRVRRDWLVAPEDGDWRLVWVDSGNTPQVITRRFIQTIASVDSIEAADDPVGRLSHSVSPLFSLVEYNPWFFGGLRRQELLRTRLGASELDSGELVRRFGLLASWMDKADIDTIAGDNAVVEVTMADDELDTTVELEWLLAPEGGEWSVVWFQ